MIYVQGQAGLGMCCNDDTSFGGDRDGCVGPVRGAVGAGRVAPAAAAFAAALGADWRRPPVHSFGFRTMLFPEHS